MCIRDSTRTAVGTNLLDFLNLSQFLFQPLGDQRIDSLGVGTGKERAHIRCPLSQKRIFHARQDDIRRQSADQNQADGQHEQAGIAVEEI
jgi:hypothetical protein